MNVQRQIDKLIAVRAAEFYEAICSGEVETSSDEFRRWISESPRHVDAFMTIAAEAPLIREVLRSNAIDVEKLLNRNALGVIHAELTSPGTERISGREAAVARPASRWRLAAISVAASLAALAAILWISPSRWQRLETAAGEQRAVTLADGSVVNLNAQSLVEVRLRDHERDLRLVHGEAIFKVAHDVHRPFNVRTSTAVVKAIGTEFAVSIRHEDTTVSVLEGKVEVVPSHPSTTQTQAVPDVAGSVDRGSVSTAVAAGQEARVTRSGTVEFQSHADVATSVAWLQRKLVFRHTLLEDMVLDINRYNRSVQLHVDGVTPGTYWFSGTFDANDPLSLADLLGREPGLSVERRGNDIYIRESQPTP